jgi:hypothetical protein
MSSTATEGLQEGAAEEEACLLAAVCKLRLLGAAEAGLLGAADAGLLGLALGTEALGTCCCCCCCSISLWVASEWLCLTSIGVQCADTCSTSSLTAASTVREGLLLSVR